MEIKLALRISIRVTVPENVINSQTFRDAIIRAQQTNTAPGIKKLFQQTVEGWQNKPDWMQHQEITADHISMQIYAGGQNANQYALVNAGSPPHPIPLQPGFLRFQKGYQSSTRPRILSSRAFVRSDPWWVARQVNHPGFDPRAFDETIADEYGPTFQQDMQDAINDAASRS